LEELKTQQFYIAPSSHIDIEWKWTYEHAREVGCEVLKNVLSLMKKHEDFTFCLDQVPILEPFWRSLSDEEKAEFKQFIEDGRFEVIGGVWVEPDVNIPCGESFVRQLLYGQRCTKETFGAYSICILNEDTFGQCVQLPQLLKKSGIRYFIFNRGVSETLAKTLPSEFYYQSPDGTKILTHWMREDFYSKAERADFLMKTFQRIKGMAVGKNVLMLEEADMYNPSENLITAAHELNEKLPTKFVVPSQFFAELEESNIELKTITEDFNPPLRRQDLRGCWESRAEQKRLNREAENLILTSEKFATISWLEGGKYPQTTLNSIWKELLFNHFHDIIGGSHIDAVQSRAIDSYSQKIIPGLQKMIENSIAFIEGQIDTQDEQGKPVIVFNQLSWRRTDICELKVRFDPGEAKGLILKDWKGSEIPFQFADKFNYADGTLSSARIIFIAEEVPAIGYKTYYVVPDKSSAERSFPCELKQGSNWIENKWYRIMLDNSGAITSLYDKVCKQDLLDTSSYLGNELVAHSHEGDLEGTLRLKEEVDSSKNYPASIYTEHGPVRLKVKMKGEFKDSTREQEIILYEKLKRIDFRTSLSFHGKNLFVRTRFPLAKTEYDINYETPYAVTTRPSGHYAAQTWVDCSSKSGGYGVSLINRGNPGYWVDDNMNLDLILLWSVDQKGYHAPSALEHGKHSWQYSLYPHSGDWRDADIHEVGWSFNNPLLIGKATRHNGKLPKEGAFFTVSPESFHITTVKKAEDGEYVAIRGYETRGEDIQVVINPFWEIEGAWAINLIEERETALQSSTQRLPFQSRRFEVKTFQLNLKRR
jgi:alpha-mannosidase